LPLDSNPDARAYYLPAMHRLEDAEVLLKARRVNGSIYLAGFAVECILKAPILANSTPKERPKLLERLKKEYGHDLEALKKEAGRPGMHMPREVVEEFRRVNTWDNNNRYDPRLQSTEDAEVLLAAAAAVIRWVERIGGKTDG
jgi:HEPN domain-containing protein